MKKIFLLNSMLLLAQLCWGQFLLLQSSFSEGSIKSGDGGGWMLESTSGVPLGGLALGGNYLEAGGFYPVGRPSGQSGLAQDDSARLNSALPREFVLHSIRPNPGKEPTVRFGLPQRSRVSLRIYNILGSAVRTLVDGERTAGWHEIRWNGRDDRGREAPKGIYLFRLETGNKSMTRKFIRMQ